VSNTRSRSSLGRRLVALTALLVVAVVGAMVWVWATSARDLVHEEARRRALSFTSLVSTAYSFDLDDQDWSTIDDNLGSIVNRDDTFVYVLVYDARIHDKILATTVDDLQGQFVADLVPLRLDRTSEGVAETTLLRDVDVGGARRGAVGDPVIDVSVPISISSRRRIGTLQVGVSLARAAEAQRSAVRKALAVGAVALIAGLLGAFALGRSVARRVARLESSASAIAAGDFDHRVAVEPPPDEVGALAEAFNRMSEALQASFTRIERTLQSFMRFVPKEFLGVIADRGIENIEVGKAEARTVTILFSDIRGYTSLSERLEAEELFRDLNEYLAAMGEAIHREGGFIDKYIGDAIMAIFDAQATDGVLRAALGMRTALEALNARRSASGKPPIDNGVGIHRGPVVMGTVGTPTRLNCTVIGDAVNLASRVEGLCKAYSVPILVTDAIVDALRDRAPFELTLVDAAATVKGKSAPVRLYTVGARSDGAHAPSSSSDGGKATHA
jgi:class 3 adenylate cyclase